MGIPNRSPAYWPDGALRRPGAAAPHRRDPTRKRVRADPRPGGTLHFVEHGRSPDANVARWQDRLTPIQRRVAGGCHLNRPIDVIVSDSGLELTRLENYYLRGPKAFGYCYEGVATKAP